ncbi:MAG: hypothetical protein E7066_03800 [Lentimicrobiaceae bacterium]|nr:hypothetical protein [Lentimicrobiaceae bacterium]
MDWINIFIIAVIIVLLISAFFVIRDKNHHTVGGTSNLINDNDLRLVSLKIVVPLKIQAHERLLLFIERMQFPILVKRVFSPVMTKDDFQFSLMQNVQDEFEHNMAQRLYVTEETWHLVYLAKEEVLQNINAVFNDNPDADVAMIAQKLASFNNPMVEKAVLNIKREFNSL